MNIDEAKRIPLSLIFEKLGLYPVKQSEKDSWYYAFWRNEKTASLHVNLKTNQWYDFGEGVGGDAVNLACLHLKNTNEHDTVADALRWLSNMTVSNFNQRFIASAVENEPYWQLIKSEPLKNITLLRYLDKRGIDRQLANEVITECYVRNTDNSKKVFALGFKNEDGGWELRNAYFKSCVAPKTITFIRGKDHKSRNIHLFEGFMDFLTVLTINKGPLKDDAIILNSLSCLSAAIPYMQNYGYHAAYTWMDNDKAGRNATSQLAEFFKTEADLLHKPLNKVYASHKDVNAWHMSNLNLSL